ncbi:MAG: HAMP domain-containing sensor histidine kinase [Actinomycetota bacterium]|nr:HAMP domain-containing sensor histidine kinase [Actinomycetota bacterium]
MSTGPAGARPSRLRHIRLPAAGIRFRLAVLHSILLFGVAALAVGAIYQNVSRVLDDEPMSRHSAFTELVDTPILGSSSTTLDNAGGGLQVFEEAVNRRALRQLRVYSVVALAVLFFASLAIGWYVAGLVVHPIGRITAVARRIQGTDLSRRISLGGPPDEFRELADTFDDMLDRLDAAFEMQRHFIQEASHELRNPLAVLRTNLDVVMHDPRSEPEDFRAAGEVALRATSRMSSLVDDLLLYAHHERPDVHRAPIDLASVVSETVADFAAAAESAGVELRAEVAERLQVVGDPVALRRGLANLLSNSIRVSDPESSVLVTAGHDDEKVWISVRDEGPGIDPDDVDDVFQRFWRGDLPSAREHGRSGLGLAIVRQIAEGHGGQATARSTVGVGSTFTIWLPRYVDR